MTRFAAVAGGTLVLGVGASVAVLAYRFGDSARRREASPAASGRSVGKLESDAALETVQGEVLETPDSGRGRGDGKGAGIKGSTPPLITLRLGGGETVRVHAGPARFHAQIGLELAQGDRIEITGRRAGRPGQAILLAETIRKNDGVFRIRGEDGAKLWKAKTESPLVRSSVVGAVVDLAPELADQVPGRERSGTFVAVETDEGKIAVQIGPEAYRTKHGLTLALGDRVEIEGWRLPGATLIDKPLMLAATIRKGDRVVQLRDERRLALWTGQ